MLGFLIFALTFVILLTLVVRLARLRVRAELFGQNEEEFLTYSSISALALNRSSFGVAA